MNTSRLILPLALLAALAAACATLRVDVDVYTGPLADHEDIQAERMAVMAIGAKPLLIELRDRLENKGREEHWDKRPEAAANAVREISPSWSKYKAGYIQPSDYTADYDSWNTLIDTKARRVNAVLGLYEDRLNTDAAGYLQKAEAYYRDILANKHVLESEDVAKRFAKLAAMYADKASQPGFSPYIEAYRVFFSKAMLPYGIPNIYKPGQGEGRSLELQAVYFNSLARKESVIKYQASMLFAKSQAAEQQEFVTLVMQRADAFLAMRQAADDLFTLNLMFLRDANQQPNSFSFRDRDEVNDAIARVTCNMLRVSSLAKIKAHCVSVACPDIEALVGDIPPGQDPGYIAWRIRTQLVKNPSTTAAQLLAAHLMAKQGEFPIIGPQKGPVPFGLALYVLKGQVDSGEAPVSYLDLIGNALDSLTTLCATGMERGRGPWGLERLIEEYLNAAEDFTTQGCGKADAEHPSKACAGPAAGLREKRDLLREELVRFAEKVLVIANHEVLLTQYSEDSNDPRAKIVENIQVLQAVANSLLSQANELRFRQEHRQALADHLPGLTSALTETYAPDGRRTLALVVSQLAAERATVSATLDQIDTKAAAKTTPLKDAEKKQGIAAENATRLEAARKPLAPAAAFKSSLEECRKLASDANATMTQVKNFLTPVVASDTLPASGGLNATASLNAAAEFVTQAKKQFATLVNKAPDLQKAADGLQKAAAPKEETAEVQKAFAALQTPAKDLAAFEAATVGTSFDSIRAGFDKAKACYALYAGAAGQDAFKNDACKDPAGKPYPDAPALTAAIRGLVSDEFLASLKALQEKLKPGSDALAANYPALEPRIKKLAEEAKAAKNQATAAATKVENLKREAAEATAGKAPAQATAAELDTAIAAVEGLRATWREPLDPDTQQAKPESPQEVVSRLHAALRAKTDKESQTAAKVIATRTFSFPTLGKPTPKTDELKDPRLALDQLLDALRLTLAREVQAGGKDAPAAVRTTQAIEVVEAQRAGLIYLRPASAYLRSSYPATSVQPGLDPMWKNTLARNFLRSIPLLGEARSTDEMRRLRVYGEIDRQSWQTVNTVRLEGVGQTNYAIAKDDIGNWYAKAYSTDPKEIIKGAKSLAMYAMGMPAGVVSEAAKKAQESGAKPATPQQTALERLRAKYAAQFEAASKQQAGDLGTWLDGNPAAGQIQNAWTNDQDTKPFLDDLNNALKSAADLTPFTDQAAALHKASDPDSCSKAILDGLRVLKRYTTAVDNKLASQEPSDATVTAYISAHSLLPAEPTAAQTTEATTTAKEAFAAARKKARDSARDILRNKLDTTLAARQATVDGYLRALTFLGEALSDEPVASSK